MSFYGLSDTHVMEMPVDRFWFLYQCTMRIEAQEDLRRLQIASATCGMGPSEEIITSTHKDLVGRVGTTIRFNIEERPDPDAGEKLRRLAGMF